MEIIPNWHPIFVHFTVALLFASTLLFIVGKFLSANVKWKTACVTAARWNLCIGAFITVGTIIAGFDAFNTVNHDDASHLAMLDHRNWALVTAGLFIVLAAWSFITRKSSPSWIFTLALLAAASCLTITGYKGGELVYRHGLGVMALPQVEAHEHHHNDDSAADHELEEGHDHTTHHHQHIHNNK